MHIDLNNWSKSYHFSPVVNVVKECGFQVAAKVIGEVQALMIFPVIPYAVLAVFYMFWLSAALHLFSSGEVVQNSCSSNCCSYNLAAKRVNCDRCCGFSVRYTAHITISIFFHLFGGFWATHFFIACSSTVIAGSVASYYWARGQTSVCLVFFLSFITRMSLENLKNNALGILKSKEDKKKCI